MYTNEAGEHLSPYLKSVFAALLKILSRKSGQLKHTINLTLILSKQLLRWTNNFILCMQIHVKYCKLFPSIFSQTLKIMML